MRAVTVDLDDTLFAQARWLEGAWSAVADAGTRRGLDRAELHAALLAIAAEGSDRGRIIDRALAVCGGQPWDVPPLVEAFTAHAPARLPLYPGVARSLDTLRAAGLRIAVITDGNPRTQQAKLTALRLTAACRGISCVVISDELGGRAARKPAAAPFLEALSQLGVPAAQAIHIGDSAAKDVAGAAGAGLRCVRVLTGEHAHRPVGRDCPEPWRTVPTFEDAARVVLQELHRTPPVRVTKAAPVRLR
ncbi:MAG TPA: HAD family hydrolase [Mycobacteriales bacterium]|nr:HAD family hydrolase [Mycobacteriales bacterium]